MPNKHKHIHFFIDESGEIQRDNAPVKLVGGVLFFGDDSLNVQKSIEESLADALGTFRGRYPQDLHFTEISRSDRAAFTERLRQKLTHWRKETGTPIYGIVIQHREDQWTEYSSLLSEKERDNRYLAMLGQLIEHSLFVNKEVNEKLTEDAAVHLHIAHRNFPISADEQNDYEALGYRVKQYDNGQCKVIGSIRASDIRLLLQQAIRYRWENSRMVLNDVKVEGPHYDDDIQHSVSEPALYLADIFLGNYRYEPTNPLLPLMPPLQYGSKLEAAAEWKSLAKKGDTASVLNYLKQYPAEPDEENVPMLAALFHKDRKTFYALYQSALDDVNSSSRRDRGENLFRLLEAVYREADADDFQSELYAVQIRFALANHTGHTVWANRIWQEYLALEPQLEEKVKGVENVLDFKMDFRCKYAVHLLDRFQYDEAENVLKDIEKEETDTHKRLANLAKSLSSDRLGWCCNTMGQVYAFQSKLEDAELYFRAALEQFEKQEDKERTWVYLGHLAGDFPENCRPLFEEVIHNLPLLSGKDTSSPLEKPFVFAVRLKYHYLYGDTADKKQAVEEITTVINSVPKASLQYHPWGLILQTGALLYTALREETQNARFTDKAKELFERAEDVFARGENLLLFLGEVCRLRKEIFLSEYRSERDRTEGVLKEIQRKAAEMNLPFSDIQTPEKVLEAIRFNYW